MTNKGRDDYAGEYRRRRRGSDADDDPAPFGDWYGQRIESDSQAREERSPDAHGSETQRHQSSPGQPAADVGPAAETPGPVSETSADASSEGPIELEAKGPTAQLSSRTERWLTNNSAELDMIESNLRASEQSIQKIWITSAFHGDGKTTVAINMGYGLGLRAGKRVLLIDGVPGNPGLAEQFAADSVPGLREILAGEVAVETALHPTPYGGLDILTAGADWEHFGHSLPATPMAELLALASRAYDYVLIDGSAAYGSSDTTRIGALCDGAIIVASCEQSKWDVVQEVAEKLRSAGLAIIGVVLNRRRFYIPRAVYRWLS
jgi:Mrp family chromosome partitioning ATPase